MSKTQKKLFFSAVLFIALPFLFAVSAYAQNTTSKKMPTANSVNLADIATLVYPDAVEPRNDIAFALLVDTNFKKILPDTLDYERYRPECILLEKGFDENDTIGLKSFPSIVVNILSTDDGTPYALGDEVMDNLTNVTLSGLAGTGYKIVRWNKIDRNAQLPDGTPCFELEYKLSDGKKEMDISSIYLLRKGKLIRITLSSPNGADNQVWYGHYRSIVDGLMFD